MSEIKTLSDLLKKYTDDKKVDSELLKKGFDWLMSEDPSSNDNTHLKEFSQAIINKYGADKIEEILNLLKVKNA